MSGLAAFARPLRLTNFSAALSGHHALGSVARNEDSPQRRHRRAQAKRFVKLCNRSGSLTEFHINDTETVVHRRLRIEPRSFQVMRFCTFEVAFQIESAPQIIMRLRMVRFVSQRSLELCDGLIQLSANEKEHAIVIMRATRLWT